MKKHSVAVITGAATGIGAATALALSRKGFHVVVNYLSNAQGAKDTQQACMEHGEKGVETLVVQADVSREEDCQKLVKATLAQWGRIDVLVNNAGTTKFAPHKDLQALNREDFLNLYAVNVVGPYQMTRACAPAMKAQGFGSVVNVSSIAGVMAVGSSIAYAASKAALNNMTKALARSLAPEIRVNAVCPGFVQTGWFEKKLKADVVQRMAQAQKKITPLERLGQPEDIATLIAFLAHEGSRHITGDIIETDAGFHLGRST